MKSYVELVKTPAARAGANEALNANADTAMIAQAGDKAVPIIPNEYYGVRLHYAEFSTEVTNALRGILQGQPVPAALSMLQKDLVAKGINPLR
jgi:hypothetical protein